MNSQIINTPIPDIAVIGTVGAHDLLLFEKTDDRVNTYMSFFRRGPELFSDPNGKEYIKVIRKGGAAHYIIREFSSKIPAGKITIFSTIGEDTSITNLENEMKKNGFECSFHQESGTLTPVYAGVVLRTDERFWSKKYIRLGAAKTLSADKFGANMQTSRFAIVTTQPLTSLISFLRKLDSELAVQLFENDLIFLFQDARMKDEIWEHLRKKCTILNLNETELWLVATIFYNEKNIFEVSPLERAHVTDNLIDRLAEDLRGTLLLIGLGALGSVLACVTKSGYYKIALPSLYLSGTYGVGAGDIAWASAIRKLLEINVQAGKNLASIRQLISTLDFKSLEVILREFIIGGIRSVVSPDAFSTYESSPELPAVLNRISELNSLNSVKDLVLMSKTPVEGLWKKHKEFSQKEEDMFETVLLKAFGNELQQFGVV